MLDFKKLPLKRRGTGCVDRKLAQNRPTYKNKTADKRIANLEELFSVSYFPLISPKLLSVFL